MPKLQNVDINTPLTMEEAKAYMLAQGTCISYMNGERYIKDEDTDWLLNHPRPHQAREAVRRNIDLIDFDEWMALENVLYKNLTSEELPLETAAKINQILWEDLDETPLELDR